MMMMMTNKQVSVVVAMAVLVGMSCNATTIVPYKNNKEDGKGLTLTSMWDQPSRNNNDHSTTPFADKTNVNEINENKWRVNDDKFDQPVIRRTLRRRLDRNNSHISGSNSDLYVDSDAGAGESSKNDDNRHGTYQSNNNRGNNKNNNDNNHRNTPTTDESPATPLPTTTATTATTTTSAYTFNATALSFSACEKLDMALEFITSLNFEEHYQHAMALTKLTAPKSSSSSSSSSSSTLQGSTDAASASSTTQQQEMSVLFNDIRALLMIITPLSLCLLLYGANFFLHTVVVCAATLGLFLVFNVVDQLAASMLRIHLDCPMKLALSIIASFVCAVVATAFFRFGLFCFGTLVMGGATYFLLDSFPALDPGTVLFTAAADELAAAATNQTPTVTSDLSVLAWVLVVAMGATGGFLLRCYEHATLQVMTATLGGIGCAYSIHTFLLLHQISLDQSVVFLLAFFISVGGWRFQRCRGPDGEWKRMPIASSADEQKRHDQQYRLQLEQAMRQQQMELANSMRSLLPPASANSGPTTSEQIFALTQSLNRFADALEKGQGGLSKVMDKDA